MDVNFFLLFRLFFHFEARLKFRLQMFDSKEYLLEEEKPKIVCLSRSLLLQTGLTQTVLPDDD